MFEVCDRFGYGCEQREFYVDENTATGKALFKKLLDWRKHLNEPNRQSIKALTCPKEIDCDCNARTDYIVTKVHKKSLPQPRFGEIMRFWCKDERHKVFLLQVAQLVYVK